jgi:hypothetical protein
VRSTGVIIRPVRNDLHELIGVYSCSGKDPGPDQDGKNPGSAVPRKNVPINPLTIKRAVILNNIKKKILYPKLCKTLYPDICELVP